MSNDIHLHVGGDIEVDSNTDIRTNTDIDIDNNIDNDNNIDLKGQEGRLPTMTSLSTTARITRTPTLKRTEREGEEEKGKKKLETTYPISSKFQKFPCIANDTPSPNNSRPNSPIPIIDNIIEKDNNLSNKSKQKLLNDIITLSVMETSCGGLCVIESAEERWTALWTAYETICRKTLEAKTSTEQGQGQGHGSGHGSGHGQSQGPGGRTDSPPNTNKNIFSTAEILRSRGGGGGGTVDPVPLGMETDSFSRHVSRSMIASNPLLEAAASIGLFSHFGSQLSARGSSTVDPATQAAAIAQMTDMGLPRDWCEVALRRCRYNVELAINMCFENGSDMPQIVAEDAIMQAAQVSRRESESLYSRRHRPPGREEMHRDRERDREDTLSGLGFSSGPDGREGRDGREGTSAAARIQYLMSHSRHLENAVGAGNIGVPLGAIESNVRSLSPNSRISREQLRRIGTPQRSLQSSLPPSMPLSTTSSSSSATAYAGVTASVGAAATASASAKISQLLDMGFPPNWCARAMHATKNDVDDALSWILSHGDELVADATAAIDLAEAESNSDISNNNTVVSVDVPLSTSNVSTEQTSIRVRDTDPPLEKKINPLSTVSGSSNVRDSDLTCTALNGGFPSVGCRGFPVFDGKWYFELKVHTAGCVQVGWVDSAYDGGADIGEGVGDDIHSWAFDGWRMFLWHESSSEWGAKWAPGDIVGCAIDLTNQSMSFYLNGLGKEIDMGLAFTNLDYSGGLYPCASFNRGEVIQFNFGSTPFAFSPPPGHLPYAQHVHSAMKLNKEIVKKFSKSLRPLVSYSKVLNIGDAKESGIRGPGSGIDNENMNVPIVKQNRGERKERGTGSGRGRGEEKGEYDNDEEKEEENEEEEDEENFGSQAFFFEDSLEEIKGNYKRVLNYFLFFFTIHHYHIFFSFHFFLILVLLV